MESFFKLYDLYNLASTGKVARMIYTNATPRLKKCLWGAKFSFLVFWILFMARNDEKIFFSMAILSVLLWLFSFFRARKHFSLTSYPSYQREINFYEKNYEYIRYLNFGKSLDQSISILDIDAALDHLSTDLTTYSVPTSAFTSHPWLYPLATIFVTLLSVAASSWNKEVIGIAMLVIVFLCIFIVTFNGLTRSRFVRLKEFQRFLIWKRKDFKV